MKSSKSFPLPFKYQLTPPLGHTYPKATLPPCYYFTLSLILLCFDVQYEKLSKITSFEKSWNFRRISRNSTISYSVLRWDLTRSVAQLGMRETAIALSYCWLHRALLQALLRRFTETRKSIRASLPHSRFISTPNVKPADTLLCHLIESTGLCAVIRRWPGLERESTAVARQTEKTSDGAPPRFAVRFAVRFSLSEHLHDYRFISNEIIVNAAQTAVKHVRSA